MIDMAVGIVMGTAVTAIVHSIVNNLLNPLIALLFHSGSLENAFKFSVHGTVFSLGAVLASFINFLAIGFAIYFFVIVPLNKIQKLSSKVIKTYKPSALNKFLHSHHFKHDHSTVSSTVENTSQDSTTSPSSEVTSSSHSADTLNSVETSDSGNTPSSTSISSSASTQESSTAPNTSQTTLSSSSDVDQLTKLQQETLNVLIQIKAELTRVQQKAAANPLDSSSATPQKTAADS